MYDKLKALLDKAHLQGMKLPYFRDPLKGTPSVSLTMLVLSFLIYVVCLVNKFAGWFSDVDGAFQLLALSSALYFGRSFSGGKTKATIEDEKK